MTDAADYNQISTHTIDTSDRRWVTFEMTIGPFPEPVSLADPLLLEIGEAFIDFEFTLQLPEGCDAHTSAQLGRPDWAEPPIDTPAPADDPEPMPHRSLAGGD